MNAFICQEKNFGEPQMSILSVSQKENFYQLSIWFHIRGFPYSDFRLISLMLSAITVLIIMMWLKQYCSCDN